MANKPIGSLPAAAALQDADLLAIEQSGTAKKLVGEHLKSYVIAAAETAVEGAVTPYIEEAEGYAEAAESAKDIVVSAVDVARQAETLAVQAKEDAQSAASDASSSKTSAQTFAANAAASASSASQASSDAHGEAERAKGYADQAAATHDGVASFNARSGNVMPQEGDYTPEMLGLEPMSEVISAGPGGAPGKNLFRTVFASTETTAVGNTLTKKGITAVIQYDGSIKFSGTSTGSVVFYFGIGSPVEAADAITYSAVEEGDTSRLRLRFSISNPAVSGGVFELPHTVTNVSAGSFNEYFYVQISSANYTVNGTVRFQKEHNAEATSWGPYPASVKIENAAEGLLFKEVTAELPIMQETNGYANPWPGGGYKNHVPDGLITGASGTIADMVKTVSRSGITITSVNGKFTVNGSVSSGAISIYGPSFTLPAGTYYWSRWAPASLSATNNKLYLHYGSLTTEANGSFTLSSDTSCRIEFFISAGVTYDNDECYCQIESGSTGTAFTPYENICPIYPVTEVEISRTATNVWDEQWELGTIALTTGANASSSTIIRAKNICPCPPNADLYLGEYVSAVFWYDANNGYIEYNYNNATGNKRTSPANAHGFRIITKSSYGTTYNNNISINYPATDTSYHAYAGEQYLVNIGINQWDEVWERGSLDNYSGEPTENTAQLRSVNFCPCIDTATYYLSFPQSAHPGADIRFHWYDANKNYIGTNTAINNLLQPLAGACYFKLRTTSNTYYIYANDISINYPSRFTEYFPYTGRAVYGGELDAIKGILTVKYGYSDLGDFTWQASSSRGWFYTEGLVGIAKGTSNDSVSANIICDKYSTKTRSELNASPIVVDGCVSMGGNTPANLQVRDTHLPMSTMTPADFKAAMVGIRLVYELANPITIQLTPQQIEQLEDVNYITANGYKVSVIYRTSGLVSAKDVPDILDSEKTLKSIPMELTEKEALYVRENIGVESHRNFIDNAFFTINQQEVTSGTNTDAAARTRDRWNIGRASYIFNNDGAVTYSWANTGAGAFLLQYTPQNILPILIGKTATLSAFVNGKLHSITRTMDAVSHPDLELGDGVKVNLLYVGAGGKGYEIQFTHKNTNGVTIGPVKLELGPISTLENDIPPDQSLELLKCQRYAYIIKSTEAWTPIAYGMSTADNRASFILKLPVPLVAKPTISASGSFRVNAVKGTDFIQLANIQLTSINSIRMSGAEVRFDATVTGLLRGMIIDLCSLDENTILTVASPL